MGIRALQGHSVSGISDIRLHVPLYTRFIRDIAVLWHATYLANVRSILRHGLKPGGAEGAREHIYFQRVMQQDPEYRPGSRSHCDVQIFFDRTELIQRYPCFLTRSNCVVTREAVSPSLITEIAATYALHGVQMSRKIFDHDLAIQTVL